MQFLTMAYLLYSHTRRPHLKYALPLTMHIT
nr:MAG TPA: hypothetical protein [Caudoviricetes sp.]